MCLGIPGEIVELHERTGIRYGRVRFGGIAREVCLACVPEAVLGDYVLVHVGMAIARMDAVEAARTYQLLEEMGQTVELTTGDAGFFGPGGAA
jgi:hydrogenase expression/formation protein HypC